MCQASIGKHDKCSKVRRDPCHRASSVTAANKGQTRTKRRKKQRKRGEEILEESQIWRQKEEMCLSQTGCIEACKAFTGRP